MGTTPVLGLPELSQSQANPDITHNAALAIIQAMLTGVKDKDLTAPPVSPTEGDTYLLAGGAPSGAWTGYQNHITIYYGAAWRFIPGVDDSGSIIAIGARHEGMTVYVQDENTSYSYIGSPLGWAQSIDAVANGDKGDIVVTVGGSVWTIDTNVVGNTKLRQGAALSVIGNATNSLANVADIAAGTTGHVLRRSGTALAFGTLEAGAFAANTMALSALVNATQAAYIGATGVGAWGERTLAQVLTDIAAVAKAGDTMTGALTVTRTAASNCFTSSAETSGSVQFQGNKFSADSAGYIFRTDKARGTIAAPGDVILNDTLFQFQARARLSGTQTAIANIVANVTAATPSSTDGQSSWRFDTCPAGSVTLTDTMKIEHSTGFKMYGTVIVNPNLLLLPKTFTVATLPAGVGGARAHVTDALAPVFQAAVAAGGAVSTPVYYDAGAAVWKVG